MNVIKAQTCSIDRDGEISILGVRFDGTVMYALLLDAEGYSMGEDVEVIIKESEVILSEGELVNSSMLNIAKGDIIQVQPGGVLTNVRISCASAHKGSIDALVPTMSLKQMDLKIGKNVYWMVKASEIILRTT